MSIPGSGGPPEDEGTAKRRLEITLELLPGDREAPWFAEIAEDIPAVLECLSKMTQAGLRFHEEPKWTQCMTADNARQYGAALLAYADRLDALKAKIKRLRAE